MASFRILIEVAHESEIILTQLEQWQSAFRGIDDLCAALRRDSTHKVLYPTASHSILQHPTELQILRGLLGS